MASEMVAASPDGLLPSVGEDLPEPYYIEDDLRKIRPYYYTYNTFCKERWRGRTLIDVFQTEFRDRPAEYYREAMVKGTVMVNGKPSSPDHVMSNGDLISHRAHRHEPASTPEPIRIIHEDDGMIVISKPSGLPVHPAGRYGYNSVCEIMKIARPGFVPHPCNRLDRLTSGIMFIAKNPTAAMQLSMQISGRTVRKEYLARVTGRFPDGEVVCEQPILSISPKLGLNRVRANGKPARSVFKRLAYYPPLEKAGNKSDRDLAGRTVCHGALVSGEQPNGTLPNKADGRADGRDVEQDVERDLGREEKQESGEEGERGEAGNAAGMSPATKKGYSIVRCMPVTGRTHQLRVHLQFLGHPVQNDPIYANRKVWGFDLGHNDADASKNTDEDVITRLGRMGKDQYADAVAYYDEMEDQYHKRQAEKLSGGLCPDCGTPLYTDPGTHELSLYLHSLRYEDAGGAWSYVSPLPAWALPPAGMSGPTEVGTMDELVEAVKEVDMASS